MESTDRPGAGWHSFTAAPHRLFLWGGGLYAVVSIALWTVQQSSLYTPVLTPHFWTAPYPQAHGFMMTYGVFGFFIFGFLLTTFPRWLADEPVSRRVYLPAWIALMTGAHGFWLGLLLSKPLALISVGLIALGYAIAAGACGRILLRTHAPRTPQIYLVCALLAGLSGILCFAWALLQASPLAFDASRWIGLYAFLSLVVLTVVHRMVPFFTSTVTPGYVLRRSESALPLFAAALSARAILELAGAQAWLWLPDAVLLITLGREVVLWRFWLAPMPPLLRILYLAIAWMLCAFALGAVESLLVALGFAEAGLFGRAALHALTVGGFGGLALGIATRVSLGHSGGGLATDRLLSALFWGYQVVPVTRVLPELLAPWVPTLAVHGFWSGFGWAAVFGIWLVRVGPVLMRPRVDGRPG